MESLTCTPRRLSKGEFLTGVGGSILVHIGVIVLAVAVSWHIPKKGVAPAFTTVNLVSMQDVAGAAPKKGLQTKGAEGPRTQEAAKPVPTAKPGPMVPIRRLRMEDPVKKTEPEIKKIESRDIPKVAETAPASMSVEKSLEKLIPKPKAPAKPAQAAQASSQEPSAAPQEQRQARVKPSSTQENPAQGNPRGAVDGHAGGTADTTARGNPEASGKADGGRVASALLALYANQVKNAINSQWSILDSLKSTRLEARLLIAVSRDGRVLDLQVEKPSGNGLFDEACVRAVRKAAPLPPIPETYTSPRIEFVINFRPEGLS
ncbi:cell envelope integrity protein TolA [Syntrophobacter fumaroxidans]|uniref:TonB family protein n=1 Tax=Syntrophobacter fumaroxidans (strain DSM 10017 / MPOB) TaxID=335543 RepID=A0LGA0_SYNFM|nr:cell envelope integrity protein TolA [Syntrophobacter fumaroxidans]ABK16452.1 TonB family protein [Syntrophobacter fumaroxidans MPOB]